MRNFFITGFKAAGKTDFGVKFSEKLGWLFVDLDQLIIQDTSAGSPYELYQIVGEEAFRRREAETLDNLLTKKFCNTVFSLGGMTPLNPFLNSDLKRYGIIILIDTPLEVIKERISKQKSIYSDSESGIDSLYNERIIKLREMADIIISNYNMEDI